MPKLTVNYSSPPTCYTIPQTYIPILYPDESTTSSTLSVTISPLTNDKNYYLNTNLITSVIGAGGATSTTSVSTNKGTVSISAGGTQLIYTPNGTYIGVDTLQYVVTDQTYTSLTNSAKVSITITRVAPTLVADAVSLTSIATGQTVSATTIDVGANDTDPQGGTIAAPTIVTAPKNGSVVIGSGNNILYTPATNFVGTDVFTYKRIGAATDICTTGLSATATVTVTVTNQPPVAVNDAKSTFKCVPVTIKIKDNDSDPEGGFLTVTIVSNPTNGTLTANPDGTYKYTPTGNFIGTDVFTYTVKDVLLATSNTATVTITVSGATDTNLAPTLVADTDKTLINQLVYTNVLNNDTDANEDDITISNPAVGVDVAVSNGTIRQMPNGLLRFTPNTGFIGTTTYNYTATDSHPTCTTPSTLSATTSVTITVSALPTSLAGKVWLDVDSSGTSTWTNFNNISGDVGTNANNSLKVFLVDNSNTIVDLANVDIDGTYKLTNVPSSTSNLKLVVSNEALDIEGTITAASLPAGFKYKITSPLIRPLGTTTSDVLSMTGYDFGVFTTTGSFGGTIAPSSIFCNTGGGTPTPFTSTVNATGGTLLGSDITYQWQSSSVSDFSSLVTNITGATAYTYSAGFTNATTYFRRVAATGGSTYYSNILNVIVTTATKPTIVITPTTATINVGGNISLTASGAGTYSWSPSSNLSASNTATVTASPLTTTLYTVTGTITSTGCMNTASITVTTESNNSLTPGSIGKDQTICIGSLPSELTSLTLASGGTGNVNYQWQQSTDSINFTNITGATLENYSPTSLTVKTYYRRSASTSSNATVYSNIVTITPVSPPVITGAISGPCAIQKDSTKTFTVSAASTATSYLWTLPSGFTGNSTTNSINIKAGNTNGTISVVPYNGSCAGNTINYAVSIIDYAKVTITGSPVSTNGTNISPIDIKIQLIDVNGNLITCSGGKATIFICSSNTTGTLSTVIDNNNGTYSSTLTAFANTIKICGTIESIPISQTLTVTFTGPQGGIKGNGPILATEVPKIKFTATAGRAPFTVIYRSAKSTKNDTLNNVTSGTTFPVAFIPSTTLYTMVSIIDANGERRNQNFDRDTTTIIVVAPTIIVTLHADPAKLELDSTWATRLRLKVKNIGVMDLTNVQVKLNLKDVFPSPVTYVLDSVRVNGATVKINPNYDGIQFNDLFSRLNNSKNKIPATFEKETFVSSNAELISSFAGLNNMIDNAINHINITNGIEVYGNEVEIANNDAEIETEKDHSVYMFGAQSELPVQVEADMFLYVHLKPNGYYEPFVMQAVALGTGTTEGATALANSLSNDNNDINSHPDITKKGDPQPTVVTLIPNPVIGSSLSASTPELQANGTYNVLLSLKLKNYGNVNLTAIQLFLNLGRMIGLPASFNIVGAVTSTNNLVINPSYDAKLDSNILLSTSQLARNQEGSIQFSINITPNQFKAIYRIQATPTAFNSDINGRVSDLSTDGTDPDPDNDKKPIERLLTIIPINTPIPNLDPGTIGILVNPTPRTTVPNSAFCFPASGIPVVSKVEVTGGSGPYLYQWQSSVDNITFNNIPNANDSIYTTGNITRNTFLRRQVVSDNQMAFSNSVYIELYPVSPLPVISASSNVIVGNGKTTLTSSIGSSYTWSTADTTRSIVVNKADKYTVTITDVYGCPYKSNFTVSLLEPYQVIDVLKTVSKAPALQSDGSFILTFNITTTNLRPDVMDSVKIKDDLSKVFPSSTNFSVIDLKTSGKLISNSLYDGKGQIELLADVSQLPALKSDSVQLTVKVFPNGFVGTLNNSALLTAKSPYGSFSVTSNDNFANSNPAIRVPAKFIIPDVDIFIPSGFSPNLDGTNDKFVIIRPFNTTINFEVFNRWGNRVFLAPDYKNEWDGKGNQPSSNNLGEDLPDGTYYYIVLASNRTTGAVRKFAGYITLKR